LVIFGPNTLRRDAIKLLSAVLQLLASAPSEFVEFGVHDDKFFFIRADDDAATITYGCLLSEGE
jgi:hypothetical protein